MSLVALPDGSLLGGSTTDPGTGGERKAEEAELYLMDPGNQAGPLARGRFPRCAIVHGSLSRSGRPGLRGCGQGTLLRVRSRIRGKTLRSERTVESYGLTARQQGPRVFVTTPAGSVYMLFVKGIVRVDPSDHSLALLAASPVPVGFGGDWLNGRIYFGSGSHVYSYGECE